MTPRVDPSACLVMVKARIRVRVRVRVRAKGDPSGRPGRMPG